MPASISIVIPVRNEARGIQACLDSWLSQTMAVEEIIVIDSGSTDGTLDLVAAYPKVKLIQIPSHEFNHGTTRNRAMQHVTGEFTLMTVGDGRAADQDVLQRMVQHFEDGPVAGVCGLQIVPHDPDKNPVDWFRPVSEPRPTSFSFATAIEFDGLSPERKREAASWDDVIAMYRTTVLRDLIPYRQVTYGEDPMWAVDALRTGHTLIYDPSARVYHYHKEDHLVTFRRAVTMACLRHWLFGVVPETVTPSFRSRLSQIRCLLQAPQLSMRERWKWFCFNRDNQKAYARAAAAFRLAMQRGDEGIQKLHDECAGKSFKVTSAGGN